MNSKLLIPAFFGVAAGLTSCRSGSPGQPNIIVFLVDDMGLMDTSLPFLTDSCGRPAEYALNRWYRTPNMERLAAQGIRFSRFYAHSVSSPSRTCLLTGQNAARHGVTNWIWSEGNNRNTYGPPQWNWSGTDSTAYTLPRMLAAAGYRTIHVGKAHFGPFGSPGENPQHLGYDRNIAGCSIGEPGSYRGEDGYGLIRGTRSRAVPDLEEFHGTSVFLTEALTRKALQAVDSAAASGQPFFLHLAHYAVHTPFMSDPRFAARYADSARSGYAKAYATLIEGMDRSLGDIMNHLETKGLAENTLILFLGDNGGDAPLGDERGYGSSAPLRGKKGTEFEGGMRVPFIAAWARPDRRNPLQRRLPIVPNSVQSRPGYIEDIYPTLAALTRSELPDTLKLDGCDLSRLLQGRDDPERPDEWVMHFPHEHRGSYFTAYYRGGWKLIYYYSPEQPEAARASLFHLAEDPEERHDLASSRPGLVREMTERMIRLLEQRGACYPVDASGREIRPRLR